MVSSVQAIVVGVSEKRVYNTDSIADIRTLVDIISEKLSGRTQQDDKTMLMERTIQFVSGLPDHSKTQEVLTNNFIDQLWNSLDHPPMSYVGPQSKYRHPDGYGNVSAASRFIPQSLFSIKYGF